MARGWESKSVEEQMSAAAEERAARQAESLTPEERERRQQRESLLLSRTRVLRDLESASNPRYRQVLEAALAHLDRKLAELG